MSTTTDTPADAMPAAVAGIVADYMPSPDSESERERLAKRAEIRKNMATQDWHRSCAAAADAEIAKIGETKERLTAEHAAKFRELRERIDAIAAKQISRLAARLPPYEKLNEQWLALNYELHRANHALEDALAPHDRMLRSFGQLRHASVHPGMATRASEHDLFTTGRTDLVAAFKLAAATSEWAAQRIDAIRRRMREEPTHPLLALELRTAQAAHAQAEQESAAAWRACLAE